MTLDKTFDAAAAEPRLYARWEAEGCFRAGAGAQPGAAPFCVMIPPPNVTGSLHMGHALNNTLQDVMVRRKRMQGFDVLWQPGQDHAGIATQMVVERQLAAEGAPGRREMGREAFVRRVWRQKDESGDTIIGQLKRLGASCDWSRNAFTLGRTDEDQMSRAVLRVFVELYRQGLIYRGKRLVNWDPHFETAISDLEVENVEVAGHFWHFKYPLANGETYEYVEKDADGNVTLRETRDYIAIATTRPETMLGDGAVAVHPSDERYAPIVGRMVHLPLCDRLIPIITDDYPDPAFGSGAVKITGAHDFNDYAVAMRNDIPLHPLMDGKARLRADDAPDNMVPAKYRGLDRFEARKAVVADIAAQGLMLRVEDKTIMQPFGDRSKVVIEPMLTDQWFVDARTLAEPALAAVREGRTVFHPENWAKTYFQWLENIEPWCISRQLWWGHQIPVWYDEDGTPHCAETEAQAQAMAPGRRLTRDPDVLDTWFSSALWPFSTLGWPDETPELGRYYPTSVLSTGFDIIFFWVARMMMMGLHFAKDVPFRDVYIHALVRDEQGRKMSKSLGNIIDPLTLIDQYGADAVRFTLTAMAAMGRDLKLDVSRVEGYRNFATKLWNAARFCEMNGCAPDPAFDPRSCREPVNRWIVGETARLREAVDAALDAYRFNDAANALYAHVWGVFCDWYVEMAKPLLQGEDGPAKAETQGTAAWALDQCLILLHPVMPFVTEALWGALAGRPKLLALSDWPTLAAADLADPQADADIAWAVALVEGVRSVRAEMGLAPGAPVPLLAVGADATARARLARVDALIRRLARLSDVGHADAPPKGAVTLAAEGATLCLPLAGVIDVAAEKARLDRALDKLGRERGGIEAKLANPAFVEKARAEVVEKERARLAALAEEGARLQAAAARLAEIA